MALLRKTWDRIPALQGMLVLCIVLLWCVPGVSACDGFLSVTSNPAGASVYIDGTYRGITPANNINIIAGQHSIRLSLNGYFDANENLPIGCEKKYPKNYPLTPIPITLAPTAIYVTCQPPYECLLPNQADSKWGTGKYTQGDASPCGQAPHVVQKTQSTQFNMFCYRPTETPVPVPIQVQPPKQVIAAKIPAQQVAPPVVAQINPDVKQRVPAGPALKLYDICADQSKTNCDGTCVDTNSDRYNCGSCGERCVGVPCSGGVCGEDCKPGLSDCARGCVDLQTNPLYCGQCNIMCSQGQSCCKGNCNDFQTDPDNCGTCGTICEPGRTCCSGSCVNTNNDLFNCGSCDNLCIVQPFRCTLGQCIAPANCVYCGQYVKPIYLSRSPETALDIVFVPSSTSMNLLTKQSENTTEYTINEETFRAIAQNQVVNGYWKLDQLSASNIPADYRQRFNFYYYWRTGKTGDAWSGCAGTLPDTFWTDAYFADVGAIMYPANFASGSATIAGCANMFGPRKSQYKACGIAGHETIPVHEAGHAVFGLVDTYCGDTDYIENDPFANVWDSEAACKNDFMNKGIDASHCRQIFADDPATPVNPDCSKPFWRWDPDPDMMREPDKGGKFEVRGVGRINDIFQKWT